MERKKILLVKSILLFLCTLVIASSCSYKQGLSELEDDIYRLQALVEELNERIENLQQLIAASQAENDWVTSIEKIVENGVETGTMIHFLHRESIFISNGKDGEKGDRGADGANGKDASAPAIGILQDSDGEWYWSMNGGWILNDAGEKVRAKGVDGIAPRIKIDVGRWWVSFDGGETWSNAGFVDGDWHTETNYTNVEIIDGDTCEVTLDNGQKVYLPVWTDFTVNFPYGTTYYLVAGTSINVAVVISPYTETAISFVCDSGLSVGDPDTSYSSLGVVWLPVSASKGFSGGNVRLVFSKGDKLIYKQLSINSIDYEDKTVESVDISPSKLALALGGSCTLSATVRPINENYHNIIWSSDNPSVAKVNSYGLVTAVSSGTCSIIATAHNGVSARCPVYVGGFKSVDLGLSVDWAENNIGAASSSETGDYFSWGETVIKNELDINSYYWTGYTLCNDSSKSLLRYNTKPSYGNVDNVSVLFASDDAATVQWGEAWRIPTAEEWTELYDKCTWEWLQSGKSSKYIPSFIAQCSGYLVIKGGNDDLRLDTDYFIFIPAGGFFSGVHVEDGDVCHYWSSTLNRDYPDCSLEFVASSSFIKPQYASARCLGMSIRPVAPKIASR